MTHAIDLRSSSPARRPARTLGVRIDAVPAGRTAVSPDRDDRRGSPRWPGGSSPAWRARGGASELAAAIRSAVSAGAPIVVTGCGTSETAAMGFVEIVREALRAAGVTDAFVLSRAGVRTGPGPAGPRPGHRCLPRGRHECHQRRARGRRATAGARTAIVTVSRQSPAGRIADIVVETGELDQGWCHAIGYLSPILAAAVVGAELSGRNLDADALAELLTAGASDEPGAERNCRPAGVRPPTCSSSHPVPTGPPVASSRSRSRRRPGSRRPTATSRRSCTGTSRRPVRTAASCWSWRTGPAVRSASREPGRPSPPRRVIGIRTAAILAADLDAEIEPDLTPAGRLLVREDPSLPAPVAALVGAATAFQLLTERLARARGTNPDLHPP